MAYFNQNDLDPHYRYYGPFKPENLVFNANLQEFAQKVDYITDLETSGKLSPKEAYRGIKLLWIQLNISKEELGIDTDTPPETI